MRRLLGLLLLCFCLPFVAAQQRQAAVLLDDGSTLQGIVVAMDLRVLQLEVAGQLHELPAERIRSCRFDDSAPATAAAARRPQLVTLPEPQEVLLASRYDPASQPLDLRHRRLWRQRLERLDEAYPWLCPAAPEQWLSLGLALFAVLSLVLYLSTRVAGQELASLPRSMALSVWFLVSGGLQFALVPDLDVAHVAMLGGNAAVALFLLRNLYGLTRGQAVVAFAALLGFLAVGFGALELVDAILRSIGNSPAIA